MIEKYNMSDKNQRDQNKYYSSTIFTAGGS